MITAPGIYPLLKPEAYHKDPVEAISLSSSIAKEMTQRSARHGWTKHPRLGGAREDIEDETPDPKQTKATEAGTLLHALLLDAGDEIEICPFENWRKDIAKAQRDIARLKGKIPTLPHLKTAADIAAKEIRLQLDRMGYEYVFRSGQKEVVIVWEENGIWLRAMIDNLIINEDNKTAELWDLKSTGKSSHPEACTKQIGDMGYDLSLEFHARGLVALRPDLAGRVKKRWVFAETNAPYSATPVEIAGEWELAAQMRCEKAIALWRRCMETNHWPHYVQELTRLQPKPWQIMDAFIDE